MKYHAFLETGALDRYGNPVEKEFKASSPERLREFIEAYWLTGNLPDEAWTRMFDKGHAIHFPTSGTIHIEIED